MLPQGLPCGSVFSHMEHRCKLCYNENRRTGKGGCGAWPDNPIATIAYIIFTMKSATGMSARWIWMRMRWDGLCREPFGIARISVWMMNMGW